MPTITAAAAGGQNICYFLDLLAFSEGTSTSRVTKNDGYDVIVSGITGSEIFTDYSEHPFAMGRESKQINHAAPPLRSTASGRYQLLLRYWRSYQKTLHLTDFSPLAQDTVAIQQVKERSAIQPLLAGNVEKAISLCSPIWASLPGNNYGQGGKALQTLSDYWAAMIHIPMDTSIPQEAQ